MPYETRVENGKARIIVSPELVQALPDGRLAVDFEPDEGCYAGWHLGLVASGAGGRRTGDGKPRIVSVTPSFDHSVQVAVGATCANLSIAHAEALIGHIREVIAIQQGHIATGTTSTVTITIPTTRFS